MRHSNLIHAFPSPRMYAYHLCNAASMHEELEQELEQELQRETVRRRSSEAPRQAALPQSLSLRGEDMMYSAHAYGQ